MKKNFILALAVTMVSAVVSADKPFFAIEIGAGFISENTAMKIQPTSAANTQAVKEADTPKPLEAPKAAEAPKPADEKKVENPGTPKGQTVGNLDDAKKISIELGLENTKSQANKKEFEKELAKQVGNNIRKMQDSSAK